MEISLFSAAAQGFLDLRQFKVFLAMLIGVSVGTFTAVAQVVRKNPFMLQHERDERHW